jgi:hypothetical protein
MPAVRDVVRAANANGNRLSAFVLGIVRSPAFQMKGGIASAGDRGVAGEPSSAGDRGVARNP